MKGLEHLYAMEDESKKRLTSDPGYQSRMNYETLVNNVDNTLVRLVQRGTIAKQGGWYDAGNYDTKPPFDVGFSAKVTVVEPKVFRVEGTWNVLPVGTRVRIVLRDKNMKGAVPAGMAWDELATSVDLEPQREVTYMQDQLFVRNRRFNRRIDMSKDPTMYPFNEDDYVIEFYYNPRQAPAHIQDKFGWSGEGMTDKNFMRSDVRPGQKVVYTKMEITRDMITRQGEWQDKAPVVKTKNYKEINTDLAEDDVLMVPSLRN